MFFPGKIDSVTMLVSNVGSPKCWKGNKCHPFNNRRGLNLIAFFFFFFQKKLFLVLFCSRRTAYIVRENVKTFTSVGLS